MTCNRSPDPPIPSQTQIQGAVVTWHVLPGPSNSQCLYKMREKKFIVTEMTIVKLIKEIKKYKK